MDTKIPIVLHKYSDMTGDCFSLSPECRDILRALFPAKPWWIPRVFVASTPTNRTVMNTHHKAALVQILTGIPKYAVLLHRVEVREPIWGDLLETWWDVPNPDLPDVPTVVK